MGWSLIDAAVEVKREKSRPKAFLDAEGLFGIVPTQWKVFLLGYAKHGEKSCWKPEKPIRGVPEREMRSDWTWNFIERYEDYTIEEVSEHFTYYTLEELEQIDLSEPVGLPEEPGKPEEFRHCISVKVKENGEWRSKGKTGGLDVEQIQRGLEAEDSIEIEGEDGTEKVRVERRKKGIMREASKSLSIPSFRSMRMRPLSSNTPHTKRSPRRISGW